MATKKSTPLIGGLKEAQIDELKQQHGKLFLITVNKDGEAKYFWFKKPTMPVLSAAMVHASDDPMKVGMTLFDNCLVLGDRAAKDDVDIFPAIVNKLQDTFAKATAELEEF